MPYYYYNGNNLEYINSGYLGVSKNENTKKCPNYTCPNCKREISSELVKCVMCNYDFITGTIDKTGKSCYEENKSVVKKSCPECGKEINEKFVQCVYCGFDFRTDKPSKNLKKSPSSKSNHVYCPNCNKKQSYSNKLCEICECDLDYMEVPINNDILLNNLINDGLDIPKDKFDLFSKNNYYNAPIPCDSIEQFYDKSIFHIESKFKQGSILYVSSNNKIISELIKRLNEKGYGEYINNDVIFEKNQSMKFVNSLIGELNKIKKQNNIFIEKFSLKLPDTIDSCKDFIRLIESKHIKYLSDDDLKRINEFIKVYWNYSNFINFTDMDLSTSKLFKNYEKKLNEYKDIYYKYFNEKEFDISVMELITKLNDDIHFTEMINKMSINKEIKKDLSLNALKKDMISLNNLISDMETKFINFYSNNQFLNKSFDKIEEDLIKCQENIMNSDEKSIILINIDEIFSFENFEILFEYVIFDDNISINEELRLYLFLISKNKLSGIKLWYK